MASRPMHYSRVIPALYLVHLLSSSPVRSFAINRTIDDELGDVVTGVKPIYNPASMWNKGTNCSRCNITPHTGMDVNETLDGTWHDATYRVGGPTATVLIPFTGTAVYVFFMVPNRFPKTTTFMNVSFALDGVPDGPSFVHTPDPTTTEIAYHQPVYVKTGLTNANHSLLISAGGPKESLILFDYVMYTVEVDDSSTTSSMPLSSLPSSTKDIPTATSSSTPLPKHDVPIGAIVGILLAAVLATFIALILFLSLRARRSRQRCLASIPQEERQEKGSDSPSIDKPPALLPVAMPQDAWPMKMSHVQKGGYSFTFRIYIGMLTFPAPYLPVGLTLLKGWHITGYGLASFERHEALAQRIDTLKDHMKSLPTPPSATPGALNATCSADAATMSFGDEVAGLRRELAELNTQLAQEQLSFREPPPPAYGR